MSITLPTPETNPAYFADFITWRFLPDGRLAVVDPLLFHEAQIAVVNPDDPLSYDNVWWYHSAADALAALEAWDGQGEPMGWYRNPPTRRKRPGGEPAKEYISDGRED